MKAHFVILFLAVLASCSVAQKKTHFRIENFSKFRQETDVKITIDDKPVYEGMLQNRNADNRSAEFDVLLSKGKHKIVISVNNNTSSTTYNFEVGRNTKAIIVHDYAPDKDGLSEKTAGIKGQHVQAHTYTHVHTDNSLTVLNLIASY